jgi:hypothetical protein
MNERGSYRQAIAIADNGELCVVPSEAWKRELLTPDLERVKLPLNTEVCRYMSFEHLETLLRQSKLYFPRVDLLGDPNEGSFSDTVPFETLDAYKSLEYESIQQLQTSYQNLNRQMMQRLFYVSCWNTNTHESELLWKRYGARDSEAVAVWTTTGLICTLRPDIFHCETEFIPRFCAGEVNYVNYAPGSVPNNDLSLFYKGMEYKDDREFRAVIHIWSFGAGKSNSEDLPLGIEVDIAPAVFVRRIVPQPNCTELKQKLNNILDELGYDIAVVDSTLERIAKWG